MVDRLPDGAWLTDLGTHPLRDLPRPERVVQLCHPDLAQRVPAACGHRQPLLPSIFRCSSPVSSGRDDGDERGSGELLADNRLVTLTGAGGVGKTRLAVQIAATLAGEFGDGVWYVDLAPITDPDVVPVTVARALGLPDQPGRSTMDTLTAVHSRPADAGGAGQLRASAGCERRAGCRSAGAAAEADGAGDES